MYKFDWDIIDRDTEDTHCHIEFEDNEKEKVKQTFNALTAATRQGIVENAILETPEGNRFTPAKAEKDEPKTMVLRVIIGRRDEAREKIVKAKADRKQVVTYYYQDENYKDYEHFIGEEVIIDLKGMIGFGTIYEMEVVLKSKAKAMYSGRIKNIIHLNVKGGAA